MVIPPAAATAGDCLNIAAALAVNMPAHALAEASSTCLLALHPHADRTLLPGGGAAPSGMLESDVPGLRHLQQTAEAATGSYPLTLAFASMLQALLTAGVSSEDVQVSMPHTVCTRAGLAMTAVHICKLTSSLYFAPVLMMLSCCPAVGS